MATLQKHMLKAGFLCATFLISACGGTSGQTSSVDSKEDSSEAHVHSYVSHAAVDATCHSKGSEMYYTCSGCDKLFNAAKEEISAVVETEIDPTNHDGTIAIVASGTYKTSYLIGETFDMTGLVITLKCDHCDGAELPAAALATVTVTYPTDGATAFTAEDASSEAPKIKLTYVSYSTEIAVTVEKGENSISGLAALEGHCGHVPFTALEGVSTLSGTVEYAFADPSDDDPSTLTYRTAAELGEEYRFNVAPGAESTVYHVRASVAATPTHKATIAYTTLTITHNSSWDKTNPSQDVYGCICSEPVIFSKTVTAENQDIDLSASVASISLEGVSAYASVESIKVTFGEQEIDLGTDLANLNVAAIKGDASKVGATLINVIVLDATGEDHAIKVPVTFATKLISTADEFVANVIPSSANQVVHGYYKQTADLNLSGGGATSFDWGYFFAGTYDGGGHSITAQTYSYGIFSQLGQNNHPNEFATIKNVVIKDRWTANWGSIMAKAMFNTTLDNVTVTAIGGVDYTDYANNKGWISFGTCQNVNINNCEFDAAGHTVAVLLAYNLNVNNVVFSNSVYKVKAYTALYHSIYLQNTGADESVYAPKTAEGLTIIEG